MLDVRTVFDALEWLAPCGTKEEWDNVGLMVGSLSSQIKGILIALDCTEGVINEAVESGANLIITHHPFIFNPVNKIDYDNLIGEKIRKLIKNDINVISMHTNLDKAIGGVNDTLCQAIDLYNIENITDEQLSLGRIGELKKSMTLKDFAGYVKQKLNAPVVKYIGSDEKLIKKVAVVSGSGSEFYGEAIRKNADVFLTSEVKHNIAVEVMDKDFAIIDAGHFETENVITEKLKMFLQEKFDVNISVSKSYIRLFKEV